MKKHVPLMICLALAAVTSADQKIYSDKLAPGWDDWSWAKVTKSGKTITVAAKAWQGLYFHHAPIDSKTFTGISFKLKVTTGKVGFQLEAVTGGKPDKGVFLTPSPIPANKWVTISIPVSKLGLGKGKFEGFWIQPNTDSKFFVSDAVLKSK